MLKAHLLLGKQMGRGEEFSEPSPLYFTTSKGEGTHEQQNL